MNQKTNIYLDYNMISLKMDILSEDIQKQNYDAIVMILRGGAFVGINLAFLTGLPYYFLKYIRHDDKVVWEGSIPDKGRILLCEDFAGSGKTLINCKKFLSDKGYQVDTFVICKDYLSASIPNYYCFECIDVNKRFILPWERHRISNDNSDYTKEYEYKKTGWDMDGVFLEDVDSSIYRESLENALKVRDKMPKASFSPQMNFSDVIITGRPEIDTERTKKWLRVNDIINHVIFRNDGIDKPTSQTTAIWKGYEALKQGCSHYVESDAEQAVHIAKIYPELRVIWWNKGNPIKIQAFEETKEDSYVPQAQSV